MIESSLLRQLDSERGWRELQERLRPFVARRVRSDVDVDDVVQDIFLRMQRGLASLQDDERFGPWVYQVARSAITDHHRSLARHPVAAKELSARESESVDEADEDTIEREVAAHAALFVSMLPSPYREALTLTELEGLTQKEAAEMVGISVSGMKSRVQRGRQKLRASLDACCHIAVDARQRVVACEPRPGGKTGACCTCCAPERLESPENADEAGVTVKR